MWKCAFAVIAAIALTLFLSSSLNKLFHSQTVSAIGFLVVMGLVGFTLLTQGLDARLKNIEIGVIIGFVAVCLMFFLRLSLPERSHVIEYSVLAVFIYEALLERASHGGMQFPWAWAIAISSLTGVVDECAQLFLPDRFFDTDDILFNTLASLFGVGSVSGLRLLRQFLQRQRQ